MLSCCYLKIFNDLRRAVLHCYFVLASQIMYLVLIQIPWNEIQSLQNIAQLLTSPALLRLLHTKKQPIRSLSVSSSFNLLCLSSESSCPSFLCITITWVQSKWVSFKIFKYSFYSWNPGAFCNDIWGKWENISSDNPWMWWFFIPLGKKKKKTLLAKKNKSGREMR